MKKTFYLVSFLISFNLTAQTYYPFPLGNAVWTFDLITFSTTETINHFGLFGDTIIGGLTYHKLYNNTVNSDTPVLPPDFEISSAIYRGAQREDASKRVWFIFPQDTTQILFYDFNLNLGDTFCFRHQLSGIECLPVALVDSILINGNYRKQIHFEYDGLTEIWIEGIGSLSNNWIDYWSFIGNYEFKLNCFKENEESLYGICNYTNLVENEVNLNSLKIYPNPVQSTANIELSNQGIFSLKISDITGRVIYHSEKVMGHTSIDCANFLNGIYFIYIQYKNTVITSRLIKY